MELGSVMWRIEGATEKRLQVVQQKNEIRKLDLFVCFVSLQAGPWSLSWIP